MKKSVIIFLMILIYSGFAATFNLSAQSLITGDGRSRTIDSLNAIIDNSSSQDTSMASAYLSLSEILAETDIDTVIPLCLKTIEIGTSNLSKAGLMPDEEKSFYASMAGAYSNIGYVHSRKGEISKAVEHFDQLKEIAIKTDDKEALASYHISIGYIQNNQGAFDLAIENYQKALNIQNEMNDREAIAHNLNLIGLVYQNKGVLIDALSFFNKSLKLTEEIGDILGAANCMNNIGMVYRNQGNIEQALLAFHRSLSVYESVDYKYGGILLKQHCSDV